MIPRLLALLTALWLIAPSAFATGPSRLAVLPLDKAAGSEAYDGLGKALAGMLVADLSQIETLQLVERDRLDALLTELDLAETGFLDPATAQTLGKGLGAEFLVTGSYSVLAEVFIMDVRVVGVASGEIAKAASANGTVTDFISVQKQAVEALVDGLALTLSYADRRKLLSEVPTESFEAFSAYAEGVARTDEGDAAAAEDAFERALRADPAFEAARRALGDLKSLVESVHAERRSDTMGQLSSVHAAILADSVDERTRPRDFEHDLDSTIRFALRIAVLENQGLDCQRYEELMAYLDRVGWVVTRPPRDDKGVFEYHLSIRADAYGFDKLPSDVEGAPPAAYLDLGYRSKTMWRSTTEFLLNENSGLVISLDRCFSGERRQAEIERVRKQIDRHAVEDPEGSTWRDGMSLSEELLLRQLEAHARDLGADDSFEGAFESLLAAHEHDEREQRWLLKRIEKVVKLADEWEERQVKRMGADPVEVERAMRGLAGETPDEVVLTSAGCAAVATSHQKTAVGILEDIAQADAEGDLRDREYELDHAATYWAILRDLGCLPDTPARFDTPDQVLTHLRTAESRKRAEFWDEPECTAAVGTVAQAVGWLETPVSREMVPVLTVQALQSYYIHLVHNRCLEAP